MKLMKWKDINHLFMGFDESFTFSNLGCINSGKNISI